MKVYELFEAKSDQPVEVKTLDEFRKKVSEVWGSGYPIKRLSGFGKDKEFWVAKSTANWAKSKDASYRVGTFVTYKGKPDPDMCFVETPASQAAHERFAGKLKRDNKVARKAERKAANKLPDKFYVGQRVKLLPFEDQPEQEGEVVRVAKVKEMLIVKLDKKYREDEDDDGIRELDFGQAVPLKRKDLN